MSDPQDAQDPAIDNLWKEYGRTFRAFDDLTLARWCSQTLGQLQGQAWRMSHPLVGAFRLAAQVAHERGLWHQRLVNMPIGYTAADCCQAPLVPLFTREVADYGLLCLHCNESAVPFDQLPAPIAERISRWARTYARSHEVAHWDDRKRSHRDYEEKLDQAAEQIEILLAQAACTIVPGLLESYPVMIWEDQDECLEVRPEDIAL